MIADINQAINLDLGARLRGEITEEIERIKRGVELLQALSKIIGAGSGGLLGLATDALTDVLVKHLNKQITAAIGKALEPVNGVVIKIAEFEQKIRQKLDELLAPGTRVVNKFLGQAEEALDDVLDPVKRAVLTPVYEALFKPLGTAVQKIKDLVSDTVGKVTQKAIDNVRDAVKKTIDGALKSVGLKKKKKTAPPPPPPCAQP